MKGAEEEVHVGRRSGWMYGSRNTGLTGPKRLLCVSCARAKVNVTYFKHALYFTDVTYVKHISDVMYIKSRA